MITFRLCFFQILGLLIVVELAITLTSRVEMPRGKITVKFLHLCKGCVMMYTRWYQHDWNTSRSSLKKLRNNFFSFTRQTSAMTELTLFFHPLMIYISAFITSWVYTTTHIIKVIVVPTSDKKMIKILPYKCEWKWFLEKMVRWRENFYVYKDNRVLEYALIPSHWI